jgi:hypothetical protein
MNNMRLLDKKYIQESPNTGQREEPKKFFSLSSSWHCFHSIFGKKTSLNLSLTLNLNFELHFFFLAGRKTVQILRL